MHTVACKISIGSKTRSRQS